MTLKLDHTLDTYLALFLPFYLESEDFDSGLESPKQSEYSLRDF